MNRRNRNPEQNPSVTDTIRTGELKEGMLHIERGVLPPWVTKDKKPLDVVYDAVIGMKPIPEKIKDEEEVESMFFPVKVNSISAYLIYLCNKRHLDYKFSCAREEKDGVKGTRVWRIQ